MIVFVPFGIHSRFREQRRHPRMQRLRRLGRKRPNRAIVLVIQRRRERLRHVLAERREVHRAVVRVRDLLPLPVASVEPGFLHRLAPGRLICGLARLDMAARKCPLARMTVARAAQEQHATVRRAE